MFEKATSENIKSKILIYGSSGTGKTTFSLLASKYLKVALIDCEKGSIHYSKYNFDVEQVKNYMGFKKAVTYIYNNSKEYDVLIIDSLSDFWVFVQQEWKKYFQGNKKNYDIQPKDWVTMRDDYRTILRLIISLDIHVICCCHETILYKDKGFMIPIGYKPDAEKGTNYLFDTTMRFFLEDRKYYCCIEKDKTGGVEQQKINDPFEFTEELREILVRKLLNIKE